MRLSPTLRLTVLFGLAGFALGLPKDGGEDRGNDDHSSGHGGGGDHGDGHGGGHGDHHGDGGQGGGHGGRCPHFGNGTFEIHQWQLYPDTAVFDFDSCIMYIRYINKTCLGRLAADGTQRAVQRQRDQV